MCLKSNCNENILYEVPKICARNECKRGGAACATIEHNVVNVKHIIRTNFDTSIFKWYVVRFVSVRPPISVTFISV